MFLRKHLIARLYRNAEPGDDGAGGEAIGSGNDARIALLNSIGDANDAGRAEELANVNDDGSTSAFELDAETQAEMDRLEAEANDGEDTVDGGAAEEPPTPALLPVAEKHKLKVNGRDLELTTEELIARAQKVESADDYLVQAARMKREAEALAPNKNTPDAPPHEAGRAEGMAPEERRALVRAIQVGTEEEAMDALEKLLPNKTPALNADTLARTVDERLNFKEAIDWFKSEYKDVLADPLLARMARDSDAALVAQGDKRSYKERYEAIGSDLRAWVAKFKPADAPAPAATPAAPAIDRAARKAAAPTAPKPANSRAQAPAGEEEAEENTSEVIAQIAKRRGGPQWMRA